MRDVCVSIIFDAFSVISLRFLQQKYRYVPKIGFSADISIDICIDISVDDFADILTGICINISIDIYTDISIYIFIDILTDFLFDISIDILTDKEEGGGRKEGRSGLLLKI